MQENAAQIDYSEQSSAPKVFGILLIIFASIMTLYGLLGGLATMFISDFTSSLMSFAGAMAEQDVDLGMSAFFDKMKPVYYTTGGLEIVKGIISIGGLFAGIWLTQYKEKGRKLALYWAYAALGYLVIYTLVQVIYIIPETVAVQMGMFSGIEELESDPAAMAAMSGMSGMTSSFSYIGVVIGTLFMAVFPVLVLIFMLKPSVKEACSEEEVLQA